MTSQQEPRFYNSIIISTHVYGCLHYSFVSLLFITDVSFNLELATNVSV